MSDAEHGPKRPYAKPEFKALERRPAAVVCVISEERMQALSREIGEHGASSVSAVSEFLVLAGTDGQGLSEERESKPAPAGSSFRGKTGRLGLVATVIFIAV